MTFPMNVTLKQATRCFHLRLSAFGLLSDFGLRISDLPLCALLTLLSLPLPSYICMAGRDGLIFR